MLTGCGEEMMIRAGKHQKAMMKAQQNSLSSPTKEVSAKLREINDWYVTDIWNVGYVISGITLPAVLLRQERSWTSN